MALPLKDPKLEQTMPLDADAPEKARGLLNVDTVLIEKLAELLQRTGLTEIELSEGEARIRVAKQPAPIAANATLQQAPIAAVAPAPPVEAAPVRPAGTDANHPGAVRAPMVGTAYLTPEPGADPFVFSRRRGEGGPDAPDRRGDEGDEPDQGAEGRAGGLGHGHQWRSGRV